MLRRFVKARARASVFLGRVRRGNALLLLLPLYSIAMAGCSNIDSLIATPTPAQVSQFASETGTLTVSDESGKPRPMYSSEYLLASINYTNQKCDEFFDKLARFQQDSSLVDKVLASSIAA